MVRGMFIRFVSGETDADSQVSAGLFCAANEIWRYGYMPEYEFDALTELKNWFDIHLESPVKHLPRNSSYERAICWFKSIARAHLARAWEMVAILDRNDILIWTIKSQEAGRIYYEDEAQVFAVPPCERRRR